MAAGLEGLGQAFTSAALGNYGKTAVQVLFWVSASLVMLTVFGVAYVLLTYKYKITVFEVRGGGKNYTVTKRRKDYVKPNKDGSWTWLFRGFKKEKGFPERYVYPGVIPAFKIGQDYFPARFDFSDLNEAKIRPVDWDIRRKIELEIQEINTQLQKPDFWRDFGKPMMISFGFAIIVIGFAAFVIWLSFKKTDQVLPYFDRLTDSLKDYGNIPGKTG